MLYNGVVGAIFQLVQSWDSGRCFRNASMMLQLFGCNTKKEKHDDETCYKCRKMA